MKTSITYIIVLFFVFSFNHVSAQSFYQYYLQKNETWNKLRPYFTPPEEFKNKFGDYRSPLLFYNGDTVRTKEDWGKRRTEIFTRWTSMLGNWAPVIKNQELEILETTQREDFTQHKVRFYWTPNEQTEGYLLIPDKKGKKPAVITVFYEPETAIGVGGRPYRDFAYQLAKRGFVTLSLGTTKTTDNKTFSIYYPNHENATLQPLSALAYAAANAWEVLAKVEEVDSSKIGIMGHSYGGKWAMFASCLYDKFSCAVWVDPGIVFDESAGSQSNYWAPWYLGYYQPPWENMGRNDANDAKGLYPKLRREGYDLHELHALMAPRPFLLSGGSTDPIEKWIPLNHSIAVNNLLGYNSRVAMTSRPLHDPNPESNEIIYLFFKYFLE